MIENAPLSVIILTKNSAETLKATLESVAFADEVILIDDNSIDQTGGLAKKYGARIISHHSKTLNFSEKRNLGLAEAKYDWVLYIDADEVVGKKLADEIMDIVSTQKPGIYRVTRDNYFLGRKMYPDGVERLFHKQKMKGWQGDVHESPIIVDAVKNLNEPLRHITHRTIQSMLAKTNEWSEIEAKLRYENNHPQMAIWRIWRIGLTEFWHQIVHKKVWRYGREGWFEGVFQVLDKVIVYVKLWELQNTRGQKNQK